MPDRAVVAISEDGQWLVVLIENYWLLYRGDAHRDGWADWGYAEEDTGQSADDVLAAFLESQP